MPPPAGLGTGTRFHVLPFQCSARRGPPDTPPTAHALVAEAAATLTSAPLPTAGVAIRFHLVPVRCRISGLRFPMPPDEPTAQSSPPTGVTAVRSPSEGRA